MASEVMNLNDIYVLWISMTFTVYRSGMCVCDELMMFILEQNGQRQMMARGIVQSVLIRTLLKRSNVPCVMFVKVLPPGMQMLLNCTVSIKTS